MSKQKGYNFDFSPTFLKGVGSSMEYYHKEFIHSKECYIEELNKLREMENVKHEPMVVRCWRLPEGDDHPRHKAKLYTQIDAYIKKHQNSNWVFHQLEETEEEYYPDPYENWTTVDQVYKLWVIIKDKDNVVKSDVYKQQVKVVQSCLEDLEMCKAKFIDFMKNYKE